MRKSLKIFLILGVISSIVLTGCGKNNEIKNNPAPTNDQEINQGVNQGIVAGKIESTLVKVDISDYQASFQYILKNQKEQEELFEFTDSCQYRYELINSKGEVIEPISIGCDQALSSFVLKQGEERVMDINLQGLSEDKYTLNAWLVSSDNERKYLETITFEISSEEAEYIREGDYVGQIDNNSIEIVVNDEANAYRLTDKTKKDLKLVVDGDNVTIRFSKNKEGQLILHDIISNDAPAFASTSTGTYLKLNDDRTVDIKLSDETHKFIIDVFLEIEFEELEENKEITFSYSENSIGQLVLLNIHE